MSYVFQDWSHEEHEYRGNHDPDEVVVTIQWTVSDILLLMAEKEIPLTDANLEKILNSCFADDFQDRSIEEGWEIMDAVMDCIL